MSGSSGDVIVTIDRQRAQLVLDLLERAHAARVEGRAMDASMMEAAARHLLSELLS